MASKRKARAELTTEAPIAVAEPLTVTEPRVAPPQAVPPGDEIPKTMRGNRKPRKPQPTDIRLTARQYVRARKYRWERCAGFLYEMRKNHPGERTRAEWEQLWDAYWARPVK